MEFKVFLICFIAGFISSLICYWSGYFDGMKSNGKCQIRIGGCNNKQEMK